IDLEVRAQNAAPGSRRGDRGVQELARADPDVDSVTDRARQIVVGAEIPREGASVVAEMRTNSASGREVEAPEPADAFREGASDDRDEAVRIGVVLDDEHELRRYHARTDHREVGRESVEVHPETRR